MKPKVHILKYEDVHANAGGHGQPMEFFGRRIAAKWPAKFVLVAFIKQLPRDGISVGICCLWLA